MNPLRILLVCRNTVCHERSGGMERVGAEVAATLRLAGHEIGLLTTTGASATALMQSYDHVWAVPRTRPGRYSIGWWFGIMHHRGWTEWDPHVVISVGDGGGVLAWKRSRRYALAMQVHGTPTGEALSAIRASSAKEMARALLNVARIPSRAFFFRSADELWPVGDEVADELLRRPYSVRPSAVRTIHNGVDPSRFCFSSELRHELRSELSLDASTSLGLTVGRLEKQKGVDLVIEALAQQPEGRHLLVVGMGPQRAELQELAEHHGIADRVTFMGWLGASEVRRAMCAADVLLFPTRRVEGLPLVVLEAIAAGLPLVTTATARVPVELSTLASTCTTSASGVSSAWSSIASSSREMRLPAKFTSAASAAALLESVARLMSRSGRRATDLRGNWVARRLRGNQ